MNCLIESLLDINVSYTIRKTSVELDRERKLSKRIIRTRNLWFFGHSTSVTRTINSLQSSTIWNFCYKKCSDIYSHPSNHWNGTSTRVSIKNWPLSEDYNTVLSLSWTMCLIQSFGVGINIVLLKGFVNFMVPIRFIL